MWVKRQRNKHCILQPTRLKRPDGTTIVISVWRISGRIVASVVVTDQQWWSCPLAVQCHVEEVCKMYGVVLYEGLLLALRGPDELVRDLIRRVAAAAHHLADVMADAGSR